MAEGEVAQVQVQDLDTDFFGTAVQQLVDAYDERFVGEPQFHSGRRQHDPPSQSAPESPSPVKPLTTLRIQPGSVARFAPLQHLRR